MMNLVMWKEGEDSVSRWIKKRINQNLNLNALAIGETGIGKTYVMLSVAYNLDPNFSINQVAFNFRDVMNIINSDWFNKLKYKIILFDEVQVSFNSRTWQSLTNKLMNLLMSTYRHQNVIINDNSL